MNLRLSSNTPCNEYKLALEGLKQIVSTRKYSDLKSSTNLAIEMIENGDFNTNITETVCALIRLFYNEKYIFTIEKLWNF